MTRHEQREIAFRLTYEMVMTGEYNADTAEDLLSGADDETAAFVRSITGGISEHKSELSSLIASYAKGFEFDRIYKTDLAALYVACYELLYTDTPTAAIVNEAVKIAKEYSDVQSYSFVNGILASVVKDKRGENK